MSRTKIAAANWKMNLQMDEGYQLFNDILKGLDKNESENLCLVFPPFVHLSSFTQLLKGGTRIRLGAQNLHWEKSGAYTGEISAEMIRSTGSEYVLIGHSERRKYFNENGEILASKTNAAINEGLNPVFCCGESLNERKENRQFEIVDKQIKEGLFHLPDASFEKIIIAYEPVWAIGTGENATALQSQEMHQHIRGLIEKYISSNVANKLPILYGGSVNPGNASEIFSQPDVDGGLIGGASLNANDFIEIYNSL